MKSVHPAAFCPSTVHIIQHLLQSLCTHTMCLKRLCAYRDLLLNETCCYMNEMTVQIYTSWNLETNQMTFVTYIRLNIYTKQMTVKNYTHWNTETEQMTLET